MIKLQCGCGHTLSLPDHLGGQKIRCKRCQKVMRVPSGRFDALPAPPPAQGPSDPAFLVQGSRGCPGCGRLYPPAVVVCVDCGLNVDSGAMLYASLEDQVAPGPRADGTDPAGEDEGHGAARTWFGRLLARLGMTKG